MSFNLNSLPWFNSQKICQFPQTSHVLAQHSTVDLSMRNKQQPCGLTFAVSAHYLLGISVFLTPFDCKSYKTWTKLNQLKHLTDCRESLCGSRVFFINIGGCHHSWNQSHVLMRNFCVYHLLKREPLSKAVKQMWQPRERPFSPDPRKVPTAIVWWTIQGRLWPRDAPLNHALIYHPAFPY